MKTIKVVVHYDHWWAKFLRRWRNDFKSKPPDWTFGTILGRHVFIDRTKEKTYEPVINHEIIHVCQWYDMGAIEYLWDYMIKQWKTPYEAKWQDVEAYAHMHDFDYVSNHWPNYKIEVTEK